MIPAAQRAECIVCCLKPYYVRVQHVQAALGAEVLGLHGAVERAPAKEGLPPSGTPSCAAGVTRPAKCAEPVSFRRCAGASRLSVAAAAGDRSGSRSRPLQSQSSSQPSMTGAPKRVASAYRKEVRHIKCRPNQ